MEPRRRSDPGFGSGPPRYPGTFLLAFREAIAGLNWQVRRWLGDAVECVDADGGEQVVGLENLFRRARRVERAEWPALVSEFLKTVHALEEAGELPTNLAEVAEQLLVRLRPPMPALPDEAALWTQPIANTNLVVSLVVDYPKRMVYVTEKMIAEASRPAAEWLERGLANLRARTEADCFEVVHEESGLLLCNFGDAYDCSRALILDTMLPEASEDGYFVAVPTRDQLLVLPVLAESLPFVHLMKIIVARDFKNAPYPISDEVFWVRGGVWRIFGIDVQGQKITLQPPEEFADVFQRFVPDEEEEGDAPESEAPA